MQDFDFDHIVCRACTTTVDKDSAKLVLLRGGRIAWVCDECAYRIKATPRAASPSR